MNDRKRHAPTPKHLRPATQRWYRAVVREFVLEDHHLKLLQAAAEAWDRLTEARETLERDGSYYRDRFGCPRPHPALRTENDARISFCRTLRELDLDVEPPSEAKRPPQLRRYV